MREIKFRCWDIFSRKMVYQPYLNIEEGLLILKDCEVMQSTGLFDCNGKEIWEDDILRYQTSTVKPKTKLVKIPGVYKLTALNHWEVVGNRFENPELLNL